MTHHFEALLQAHCERNPDVAVLRAQWDFDRELLSSALQNISQTFPHYSRHDATHSHTILIQVERFLGATATANLSAIDLWLLLEAAYHHDSGMIVTSAELEALWDDKRFREFLIRLQTQSDPDMVDAARWLLHGGPPTSDNQSPDAKSPVVNASWPLHVIRAVRLVVAEYRRRVHAEKSANVVREPGTIGLASPRTGLIPARLFDTLARICAAHGSDFDEVMRLPHREAGIANDSGHPRFIACLLRLGDLLDMDNNRFCPVMLSCAGTLPRDSRAHVAKHAAITHLRIDSELIEVQAECSSDDAVAGGYEAVASWLEMLRTELRNQQENWTKIVPSSNFGSLPSIGAIEVRLRDLLSLGALELDVNRVMKMLRGANLYDNLEAYIREVLQNAVDATLIRLWIESSASLLNAEVQSAVRDARNKLKKWPIEIFFDRMSEATLSGKERWRLVVKDEGCGISRDDLDRMRHIGSSTTSSTRSHLISAMPNWLQPSGIFGIGLQSLFLVTDEIQFDTRSITSGQRLQIRMLGSRGSLHPTILVREELDAIGRSFGTTLECYLELESMPKKFTWSMSDETVSRAIHNYDPLVDERLPVDAARIEDRVSEFGQGVWVPIKLAGQYVQISTDIEDWYFDESTSIVVQVTPCEDASGSTEIRFRGAHIEHFRFEWPFFHIVADIYSGTAEEVLTLSREKLRADTAEKTRRRVVEATERALMAWITNSRKTSADAHEIARASLTLFAFGESSDARAAAGNEWRQVEIANTEVTFGDVAAQDHVKVIKREQVADRSVPAVEIVRESEALNITMGSSTWDNVIVSVLHRADLNHCQLVDCGRLHSPPYRPKIILHGKIAFEDPIANDSVLVDLLRMAAYSYQVGCRRAMPCPRRFADLAVRDLSNLPWIRYFDLEYGPPMVLPFAFIDDHKIKVSAVRELVAFVVENAVQPSKRQVVANAYIEFLRHVETIMSDNAEWKRRSDYSLEMAINEFKKVGLE